MTHNRPHSATLSIALAGILLATCLVPSGARAAFAPPDSLGWAWADSDEPGVDTSLENPIGLTPVAASLPDDAVFAINLGFPFTLYNQTSNTVYFSTNGWISLRDPAGFSAPVNTDLPDPAPPNATIAYLWDDHDGGGAGSFAQHGPTPNGHIFFIRHVAKGTGAISQLYVQFYNNNSVKVVYVVDPDLSSATVGIESEVGAVGQRVAFNGLVSGGANLRADYAVLFYKPQIPACASATPLACSGSVNGSTAFAPNDVTTYGCAAGNYDGKEAVYALTITSLARLDLTLTGTGGRAQDVFLLRSCDASLGCRIGGATSLSLPVVGPGTYYVVVDGRTALDDGPHTLTATCSPAATPIACGATINDSAAGASGIDNYLCFAGQPGPERLYSFTLPTPQTVAARLTPTAPFNLVLARASEITAGTTSCAVGDDSYIRSPLRMPAGDYVLIVDGPMGASGNFTLQLDCDTVPPVFPLGPGEVAVTCGAQLPGQAVVATVDVRNPGCDPNATLAAHWPTNMFHNDMPNGTFSTADVWNETNLGQVFGITLDDATPPNLYVTSTSVYNTSGYTATGNVFRLDGNSGAITTIATLPNTGTGLGNLAFDRVHRQLFVTNHDDGQIYRLDLNGAVLDSLDPFLPDDGLPGFAPLGERLWGVAVWAGRLYFSVWAEDQGRQSATADNTVWSVGQDAAGALLASDVTLEITMPPLNGMSSNPVAGISFSGDGRMMLAERTMSGDDVSAAHQARILEYGGAHLNWTPSPATFSIGINSAGLNAVGGAAYACPAPVTCDTTARVWATGDWVADTPGPVYGLIGLPQSGGDVSNSYAVDFDGTFNTNAKNWIGSVEIYRDCPCVVPPQAALLLTAPTCGGVRVTLDASASSGCAAGLQYRWLDGATPVCDWSPVPTCDVTPVATTTYTLEVRCLEELTCTSSDAVTVTVIPTPLPVLIATPTICLGDAITLDASGTATNGCTSGIQYQFRDGATILQPWSSTPTHGPLTPTTTTTYTVEVSCGSCQVSTQTTVTVAPRPIAAVNPDVSVCAPGPVQLDAAGSNTAGCPAGALYEWWQGATLVQPASGATTYIPPTTVVGTLSYTVVVSCAGLPGCDDPALVNVTVRDCSLAVRFEQLSATRIDRDHVAIRWTTSSELGSVLFAVERAAAPEGPFTSVGTTSAEGGGASYRLTDEIQGQPLWYRVVEHTASGRGDVSATVRAIAKVEGGGARGRRRTQR